MGGLGWGGAVEWGVVGQWEIGMGVCGGYGAGGGQRGVAGRFWGGPSTTAGCRWLQ